MIRSINFLIRTMAEEGGTDFDENGFMLVFHGSGSLDAFHDSCTSMELKPECHDCASTQLESSMSQCTLSDLSMEMNPFSVSDRFHASFPSRTTPKTGAARAALNAQFHNSFGQIELNQRYNSIDSETNGRQLPTSKSAPRSLFQEEIDQAWDNDFSDSDFDTAQTVSVDEGERRRRTPARTISNVVERRNGRAIIKLKGIKSESGMDRENARKLVAEHLAIGKARSGSVKSIERGKSEFDEDKGPAVELGFKEIEKGTAAGSTRQRELSSHQIKFEEEPVPALTISAERVPTILHSSAVAQRKDLSRGAVSSRIGGRVDSSAVQKSRTSSRSKSRNKSQGRDSNLTYGHNQNPVEQGILEKINSDSTRSLKSSSHTKNRHSSKKVQHQQDSMKCPDSLGTNEAIENRRTEGSVASDDFLEMRRCSKEKLQQMRKWEQFKALQASNMS